MNDRRATICVPVLDEMSVFEARRAAREAAAVIGFERHAREEIVLVASELAWNILKYGVRGDLTVRPIEDEQRGVGLEMIARDVGPPFADFELALRDGFSDRGPIDPVALPRRRGFGGGLGAVARMSDGVTHLPGDGEKRVRAVRYLRRSARR